MWTDGCKSSRAKRKETLTARSLGVCVHDVSESRTCSGSLRSTPNKVQPTVVWESNTLTTRNPKELPL